MPFIKIIGIVSAADRETVCVCVCEFVCKRCKRQIMRKNGNPMENNLNKQTNTHRHFECHMRSTMFRCTIARRTSRQPAKRNIHLFQFNEILAALVKVNIRKHQVFVRSFGFVVVGVSVPFIRCANAASSLASQFPLIAVFLVVRPFWACECFL